jgi:hypothetical protein
VNPIKKYRELRRELRRAKGEDIPRARAALAALEAQMTPKQRESITEEYKEL